MNNAYICTDLTKMTNFSPIIYEICIVPNRYALHYRSVGTK